MDAETSGLYRQIRALEDRELHYNSEVLALKKQNAQLKDWAHSASTLKDSALAQARENSAAVDRLERDNSDVRQRLYQLEIEKNKLQFKNDGLKERLAQVPDLRMGAAGRPPAHAGEGGIGTGAARGAPVNRITREPRRGGGGRRSAPNSVLMPMHQMHGQAGGNGIAGMNSGTLQDTSLSALSSITGYNGKITKHFG